MAPPPARDEHPSVRVRMLPETYEQGRAWIAEQGLGEDEGWHAILSVGLAQLRAERRLQALNAGEAEAREELDRLFREVMSLESKLAGLRFRSFELDYENRVLGYNLTGYKVDNEGLVHRIGMFREEVATLKAERDALRREVADLRDRLGLEPSPEPSPPPAVPPTIASATNVEAEHPAEPQRQGLGARLRRLFS